MESGFLYLKFIEDTEFSWPQEYQGNTNRGYHKIVFKAPSLNEETLCQVHLECGYRDEYE
jgi:hypothetical protein